MKFLVQKNKNNKINFDFIFELIQAQEFYDWINEERLVIRWESDIEFKDIIRPDRYIPVGSVEFVSAYAMKFYPNMTKALLPLNVPDAIIKYSGRLIKTYNPKDNYQEISQLFKGKVFCKSETLLKDERNGIYDSVDDIPKEGIWQISELIDIISEWRVFVFKNEILYVANYLGDCLIFPDVNLIKEIIEVWKNEDPEIPVAYTIDVAIKNNKETIVLECHRFFSCGLYGFSNYSRFPKMLSQTWHQMKTIK